MLGCFRPLDGNNGSAFVRCLLHTVSVYFFMNPICIDLGSRNTRIVTVSNGKPELFALKGNPSIPTFVYKGRCTAIGNDAVTAGERDSSYLFGNLVNLIGRSFSENDMSVLKSYLPCSVTDGKNHRCMVVGLNQDSETDYDPTVILSFFVRNIIDQVYESGYNQRFDSILLSYPHTFTDLQKDQLRKVANYTGLKHVDLVSDTLAACLYSGVFNSSNDEVVIVVDCGVLTFDVSLIDCQQGKYNVIASEGFNNVGGDSFTNVLLLMALQKLGMQYESLDVHDLFILREKVEAAKIEMSETGNDATLECNGRTITLSNSEFEKSCYMIIGGCCNEIKKILKTAREKGLTPTTLVLAGRATRLPCFQRAIVSTAQIRRAYQNVDASVALGLAMYSMTESYQKDHEKCVNCNPYCGANSDDYGSMANPAIPDLLDYDFSTYDETYVDNSKYPAPTPIESAARESRQKLNEKFLKKTKKHCSKSKLFECDRNYHIENDVKPQTLAPARVKGIKLIDRDMYNIGIRIQYPLYPDVDLDLLYKRNDELNQTTEKNLQTMKDDKSIYIILYQGKSMDHQQCTKIRQYEYVIDQAHTHKNHGYTLNVTMQSSASIDLKLTWKDNGQEIKIMNRDDLTYENMHSVYRNARMLSN